MLRWISLAITLLCFGSCSFLSQNVFRGMIAPVGVIVFGLITVLLFARERVASVARSPVAAVIDPETQLLLRKRAAAQAAGAPTPAASADPPEPSH